MSEAREDLPPRSTPLPPLGVTGPTQPSPLTPQMGLRLAAGGLRPGNSPAGLDIPFDPQSLRVAAGGVPVVPAAGSSVPSSGGDVYSQAVSYFAGKGLPLHVAQGIADNISRESGGDPVIRGDGGTSVGLFQAHDDRMKSLMSNPNWQTPQAQFDWAWQQMHGGDRIATENFNRIAGAGTRAEANQAFKDYFERPAGSVGGQIDVQRAQGQSDLSRIGGEAHAILDEIRKSGGRSQETFQMLADARKKMADYEERALKLAERGPSNDPRDVMQRMGGLATVIGVLGGFLTHQPMMASLNAGAAAMEAYNQQDEVTYKANVEQWRTHIDTLQKMGQVQHNMLRDILDDEKVSINERLGMAQVTLSALGNERLAQVAAQGNVDRLREFLWEIDKTNRAAARHAYEFNLLHGPGSPESETKKTSELFDAWQKAKETGDPEKIRVAQERWEDWQKRKGEGSAGLEGGKTDIDRQAKDILAKRAQDRGISYDEIVKDPAERMSARTEAASMMGESRSPGVMMREQQQADKVVAVLDQADDLKDLIDRGLTVGLGGKIMRPTESLENMLHFTDDTTRRDVEAQISLLKATAGRLLTGRSVVTAREHDELNKIVRGMSMGDTIQNTKSSIDILQKFIKRSNVSLLKKFGYGDDLPGAAQEQPQPSPAAPVPGVAVPEWQSAPLAQ